MRQFRQFRPRQFQPFMQQSLVQPFAFNQQQQPFPYKAQYALSLSKRWMNTILSTLKDKYGLDLHPQQRVRKVTYQDHQGNFSISINGYLTDGKELIFTHIHHWQVSSKEFFQLHTVD